MVILTSKVCIIKANTWQKSINHPPLPAKKISRICNQEVEKITTVDPVMEELPVVLNPAEIMLHQMIKTNAIMLIQAVVE